MKSAAQIPVLYAPMERALLSRYLKKRDPRPGDLRGMDVKRPVPEGWDEQESGVGPRENGHGGFDLMIENAVARICLAAVDEQLPRWASVGFDGNVTLGRPHRMRTWRARSLASTHLFTINWADSAPGCSWPEAYYVTWLPGYGVSVVTASADSWDTHGYCDVAIGYFAGEPSDTRSATDCVTTYWRTLKAGRQERWAYLLDSGAFDETGVTAIADAVWSPKGSRRATRT